MSVLLMFLCISRFLSRECSELWSLLAPQDDFNFTFNPKKIWHTIWKGDLKLAFNVCWLCSEIQTYLCFRFHNKKIGKVFTLTKVGPIAKKSDFIIYSAPFKTQTLKTSLELLVISLCLRVFKISGARNKGTPFSFLFFANSFVFW